QASPVSRARRCFSWPPLAAHFACAVTVLASSSQRPVADDFRLVGERDWPVAGGAGQLRMYLVQLERRVALMIEGRLLELAGITVAAGAIGDIPLRKP